MTKYRTLRTALSPTICGDSGYSILGRECRLWAGVGTRNFTDPHFPIGGLNHFHALNRFNREIGVRILFIEVARGVA